MIIGALYHPAKPVFREDSLIEQLERSVEELALAGSKSLIVLAGVISQLEFNTVVERTGLTPLIKALTRGNYILDMLFESEPSYTWC